MAGNLKPSSLCPLSVLQFHYEDTQRQRRNTETAAFSGKRILETFDDEGLIVFKAER